jgi:putative spermidine/putrescine transport system substrate-binding protein
VRKKKEDVMNRRVVAAVIGLMLLLSGGSAALAQAKEFVVASWGGLYEEGWRKSLVPAFEKKYGVKVIWVPGVSSATIAKMRAQKDNPQIDVAMMDDGPHRQAVALGLVDRVDRAKLTHARDLYEIAFEPEDHGIGFGLTGSGLFYNTKAFAENRWAPPTSWLDLYRPELKGKVSVHSITHASGVFLLLALNKLAGGTESNVSPGFAKARELAPHVLTFDKFGETPTLIQQGTSVLGTWFINSVISTAAKGVPVEFVYPKEGTYGVKEVITIVKGRPNQDLAHKFIDMLLSKEEQENTARYIGLGPVNKQAKLEAEFAKKVIYGEEFVTRLVFPDWTFINANRAAWTERWNKEVERR